jgi:hypothetical protein
VPRRVGALEHEWKDGESWHPVRDPHSLHLIGGVPRVLAWASVRILPLTTIMEVNSNPSPRPQNSGFELG